MFDATLSPAGLLTEQVAREIFDIIPEDGPIMVILDRQGNSRPSNSEKFIELNLTESFIAQICQKIDDGQEPLLTQTDDCTIVSTQLYTKNTNCGYIMLILPKYTPESALVNIDIIEMLLNMVNLTTKVIEKNNMLYDFKAAQTADNIYDSQGYQLN